MPRYSREVSKTFEVTTPLEIDLSTVNGRLVVSGQDGTTASVEARARFHAGSDELADQLASLVEEEIEYERGRLRLRTPHEAFPGMGRGFLAAFSMERKWHQLEIDYELKLPRQSQGELRCVNGSMECSHLTGPLSASSVNGSLEVDDVPRPTKLTTVNGRIEARNYGGGEARITNGRLLLRGALGPIDLSGMNGRVEVDSAAGPVTVNSMNGPVTLSGAIRGDIDVKTLNGAILLQVPAGSSFEIDAFSQGGDVSSDLDVHEEHAGQGKRPLVRLRSNHGRIHITALEHAAATSV
jgi:DUF4097 and DUF4098 domain-containing protein YvlB